MRQMNVLTVRRGLSLLLALFLLLTPLTGCGGQEPKAAAGQSSQTQAEEPAGAAPEPAPEPEPDPVELALEQYRAITGQADTYDYTGIDTNEPTGEYRYALVRMAPEDGVPALLLEQGTMFGVYHALVFRYDAEDKTVRQADGTLMEGAASAGGYRGSLSAAGDGNGLLSTEFSSGSGLGTTSRVTLEGDTLRSEVIWEGNIFIDTDTAVEETGFIDINWHDVSETAALDSWTPDAVPPQPEETQPAESDAVEADLPADGDRIVFTGTLGSYSYNEVLALQGLDDPNAGGDQGETYWLIVLDKPQQMALCSIENTMYEDEVSIVNVIDAGELEQYDGQRLTVSIDASNTWWPSDTSLPIGQPSTSDIHVLQ